MKEAKKTLLRSFIDVILHGESDSGVDIGVTFHLRFSNIGSSRKKNLIRSKTSSALHFMKKVKK